MSRPTHQVLPHAFADFSGPSMRILELCTGPSTSSFTLKDQGITNNLTLPLTSSEVGSSLSPMNYRPRRTKCSQVVGVSIAPSHHAFPSLRVPTCKRSRESGLACCTLRVAKPRESRTLQFLSKARTMPNDAPPAAATEYDPTNNQY